MACRVALQTPPLSTGRMPCLLTPRLRVQMCGRRGVSGSSLHLEARVSQPVPRGILAWELAQDARRSQEELSCSAGRNLCQLTPR